MSILTLFVVIPALMLVGLWLAKSLNQVRGVMVAGASCLLALSVWLTIYFVQQRAAGNTDVMLLTASTPWFKPLNIAYSVGVDGISVVMLLLSSIIVFTGTFASWQLKPLTKEYFLWFTLLSTGVYGFFICTDLFTMFMFYEVALIPMYLLIGVWGSGNKEYAAMKLTLMLMGGSTRLLPCTTFPSTSRRCSSPSSSSASVCWAPCSPSTHGHLTVMLRHLRQCQCFTQVC